MQIYFCYQDFPCKYIWESCCQFQIKLSIPFWLSYNTLLCWVREFFETLKYSKVSMRLREGSVVRDWNIASILKSAKVQNGTWSTKKRRTSFFFLYMHFSNWYSTTTSLLLFQLKSSHQASEKRFARPPPGEAEDSKNPTTHIPTKVVVGGATFTALRNAPSLWHQFSRNVAKNRNIPKGKIMLLHRLSKISANITAMSCEIIILKL